jgi:hypothetical protein
MIIGREQRIVGRPAVEVRDLMRAIRGVGFTIAERTGMTEAAARRLVRDFQDRGFIDRVGRPMSVVTGTAEDGVPFAELTFVTTTIAGNALATARIGKRMDRSVAHQLLREVINRADAVNHGDRWLHWVRHLILYGSLAADSLDAVGDVDVAVVIEARFNTAEFNAARDR